MTDFDIQQNLCETAKPVWNGDSIIDIRKILMTNGSLMQVKSIAECSLWSILQYFWPASTDYWYWKPILFFLEWPFYTGFTVFILNFDPSSHLELSLYESTH